MAAVQPNQKVLLIPRKGTRLPSAPVSQDDHDTNMRAIETWAKNVGGTYASLTGPGETTTPGALTQEGDFTVNGGTITLNSAENSVLVGSYNVVSSPTTQSMSPVLVLNNAT